MSTMLSKTHKIPIFSTTQSPKVSLTRKRETLFRLVEK